MEISNVKNKILFIPYKIFTSVFWMGRKIVYGFLYIPSKLINFISNKIFKNYDNKLISEVSELKKKYLTITQSRLLNQNMDDDIDPNVDSRINCLYDNEYYDSGDEIENKDLNDSFHSIEVKKSDNEEVKSIENENKKVKPYNLMDKIFDWKE